MVWKEVVGRVETSAGTVRVWLICLGVLRLVVAPACLSIRVCGNSVWFRLWFRSLHVHRSTSVGASRRSRRRRRSLRCSRRRRRFKDRFDYERMPTTSLTFAIPPRSLAPSIVSPKHGGLPMASVRAYSILKVRRVLNLVSPVGARWLQHLPSPMCGGSMLSQTAEPQLSPSPYPLS